MFQTLLKTCTLLLLLLSGGNLHAQLVADDNIPGVLIEPGYDIELAIGGLNYPSNIAHDGAGRVWITEAGFPGVPPTVKELSLDLTGAGNGSATIILTPAMLPLGMAAPPFTDLTYHNGMMFLSHRQMGANGTTVGCISRFNVDDPAGTFQTILTNLPSTGDHSNNTIVFNDAGRAYISLGSATNTGVVGADNDWVPDAPLFAEIAPVDMTFRPNGFTTRVPVPFDPEADDVTAAYRPFGTGAEAAPYTVPAVTPAAPNNGIIAGSGTVYSFDPMAADAASTLQLEAWGLRNPFGIGFDAADNGRLFISNNGSDVRGQPGDPNDPLDPSTFVIRGNRPVANDYDDMFVIETGGNAEFFGWPDFLHDIDTNEPVSIGDDRFCNNPALTDSDCAEPVFEENYSNSLTVEPAFAPVGPYVSVTGFMASESESFGYLNSLFVTESGSFSPQTGAFSFTGYKVARYDNETGEKNDFLVNEGDDVMSLFVPEKMNKPVSIAFMGDMMLVVDLGVLEPGVDIFESGTGKVWVVANGDISSTDDLSTLGIDIGEVTPNPAATTAGVTLKMEQAATLTATVHDLSGRPMQTVFEGQFTTGTHRLDLDLSPLPAGSYLIRFVGSEGATTRRFVVVN